MLKFCIGREDLLKPLEQVSGPASASPQGDTITLNVLLRVQRVNCNIENLQDNSLKDANFKLQMICSDTEIEMISEVGLFSDEIEEGETTVNVGKLVEIIKSLPDATYIKFCLDANNLIIQTELNNFALATLFELKIKHKELLNLMRSTAFSIAVENYRVHFKGMRFEISGKTLNIYTADGHRLSMQKGQLEEEVVFQESYKDNGFIFPKKGVTEVIKLLDLRKTSEDIVTLSLSKNSLKTTIDGISLVSKLIDGKYPDVSNVIPRNCSRFIVIDRESLMKTIRRVSILCNSKNNAMEFLVKSGKLTIKTRNSQHEEAKEKVEIEYQGDDFELAYNSSYFMDICKVVNTQKLKISMPVDSNAAMVEGVPVGDEEPSFARYIVSRVVL